MLHIGQHLDGYLSVALKQTEDRRLFLLQCPASTCAFQAPPTAFSPQFSHDFRVSLVTSHYIDFIRFYLAPQLNRLFLSTTPARSWVVIAWTSPAARPSSAAICSFDKFKPIRYRHNTQTFRGW